MRFTSLKRWQQMGSGLQNSPVELIKKKKRVIIIKGQKEWALVSHKTGKNPAFFQRVFVP